MKKNDFLKDSELIRYLDMFSAIATESFYAVDVQNKQFCYVRPDDLFLCGYTVEDALNLRDDFFSNIVYSKDLPLWKAMNKAVLQYLEVSEEPWEVIDYFSCTFRLQRTYSFSPPNIFPQMVFHRMKPVWEDGELRYLICSIASSTAKETGNLRMYGKDGLTCKEYRFASRRWKQIAIKPLTERERAILMLAQQGKSSIEIADDLLKGHNTIRNQIKPIFEKLDVHSMIETIDIASNHRMIYVQKKVITETARPPVETFHKRTRVLVTDDMMQRIQQHLDDGLSMRKAADREGVSECAIRYWKRKGKLK